MKKNINQNDEIRDKITNSRIPEKNPIVGNERGGEYIYLGDSADKIKKLEADLISLKKSSENSILELKAENNSLKNSLEDKKISISDLESKVVSLRQSLQDKNSLNSELETENASLKQVNYEINETNSFLTKTTNDLNEKVFHLEARTENLIQEISSLKSVNPFLSEEVHEESNSEYDCIIDIKNFKEIGMEGWELKLSKDSNLDLEKLNETGSSASFISVTGAYNKGKSFVLNKICGTKFPSGIKTETLGISFKKTKIQATDIIILDTAGTHGPIKVNEKINEKRETEKKIRDLVFQLSDIFILVVNDYTITDQEILEKLERQVRDIRLRSKKEIIVLHNIKDAYTEDDAIKSWKRQVLDLYDLKDQKSGEAMEQETQIPSTGAVQKWLLTKKTRHLLMINDKSEYGVDFNKNSIELIKMWISSMAVSSSKKNLFDEIYKTLSFKVAKTQASQRFDNNKKVDTSPESSSRFISSDQKSGKIILKYEGLFALTAVNDNGFTPCWDTIKTSEKFIVIVDTPGVERKDIKVLRKYNIVTIKGERKKEYEDSAGNNDDNTRTFGSFSLDFKIPKEYSIERKIDWKYENGCIRIEWPVQSFEEEDEGEEV